MSDTIAFRLNGQPVQLNVDQDRTLLWVLRTDLGLTGTKYGCGESHCGSCTVLVNDRAMRSCALTVKEVQDKEVVTIEGWRRTDRFTRCSRHSWRTTPCNVDSARPG